MVSGAKILETGIISMLSSSRGVYAKKCRVNMTIIRNIN
jgi:hypothetical protein